MKQIIQHLRTGETLLEEIPIPAIQPGHVLIQTVCTLVSTGTEKMLVEFSKSNLLAKARQQPERVEQVLQKIKSDGLLPTLEAVFSRLDEPLPLGYCNSGIVVKVADDVHEFKAGDRVASNGCHAEFVSVPKNLVVKIPDEVSFEEAAFTSAGAIALQSIRLIQPQLGDRVVVIGLGLIGLLTAQLLRASGVIVIGFDIAGEKVELAKKLNIRAYNSEEQDIESISQNETAFQGADAVIIAASSKNSEIINQSAKICRKKGRIVLVGVTGIEINRDEFYKKELSFQVSCSYGPGRYDEQYEKEGVDYPLPYVRFTAKRNFESFLSAVADKKIDLVNLITNKSKLEDYATIYNHLPASSSIASLLIYPAWPDDSQKIELRKPEVADNKIVIGIIGAGNFTKSTLIPIIKKTGAAIKTISSLNGLNAAFLAKKFNLPIATTDTDQIMNDPDINLVMITTRHDSHAGYIIKSLEAGKHVFVEKPLAINAEQLEKLISYFSVSPQKENYLFIGFNRRFAPLVRKAKALIGQATDLNILINVNAGKLPPDHWLLNSETGGGRIVGEACHFFDLMSFLASSEIVSVFASSSGNDPGDESTMVHLKFKNGCQGVINYFTNGHRSYPKESIEINTQGKILVIDNFRKMTGYGFKNFSSQSVKQNKGHHDQFSNMIQTITKGEASPISFQSMMNTTKATFAALQSIKENKVISVS